MKGVTGEPPNEEEAHKIKTRVNEFVEQNPDAFLAEDVERLMREEYYLARFFMHAAEDTGGNHIEATFKKIKKAFEWRKLVNPAAVKPEHLSPILKELGSMYIKGHDIDGKPLVILAIRNHPRGIDTEENNKNYFHYFMEKIDKETPDGMTSMVFECTGAGLKHLDLEQVQYMITMFRDYYPYALNYILVLDMPWVLNAAWKIIKAWLPPAGQQKTKFLTRSNISDYIPEDQQLVTWGGTVEYEYSFEKLLEPLGKVNDEVDSTSLNGGSFSTPDRNGMSDAFGLAQSLTNLESSSELMIDANGGNRKSSLLSINPSDEVIFEAYGTGNNVSLMASLILKNISADKRLAFKIMTTNPEKYKVRPCLVALDAGEPCEVKIIASASQLRFNPDVVDSTGKQAFTQDTILSVLKDKFLVTATTLKDISDGGEKPSYSELTELMRTCVPEAQYRLRCKIADVRLPAGAANKPGGHQLQQDKMPSSASSTLASANKQLESLINKVNRLDSSVTELHETLSSMKKMVLILLLIIFWIQVSMYYRVGDPSKGQMANPDSGRMAGDL